MIFERDLHAALDASLDVPDGLAGSVWQGELPGVVHDILTELVEAAGPDIVDERHLLGLLVRELASSHHNLHRLRLTDQSRQACGATGSGEYTEGDFGQTDLT